MATFLTSPRMNPALRARVERAVSRRKRATHNAARAGLSGVAFEERAPFRYGRLLPVLALGLVIALGYSMATASRRELEQERASLLAELATRRSRLPAGYLDFLARTTRWLDQTAAVEPAADLIDPSLRSAGLDLTLARPTVYLHAAAPALRDPQKQEDAVGASIKDAFLWCLLRAQGKPDADVLASVRGTYFGGAKVDDDTSNVKRLGDARLGLDVLGPAFEDVVRHARDVPTLKRLRKVLDAAPTEQAARAASAEILLVVGDAALPGGGREARVTVVDLETQRPLLQLHPRVDEIASKGSGAHREQVEACGLALAVRRAVSPR